MSQEGLVTEVTPSTFIVGYTTIDEQGIWSYLQETGQGEFMHDLQSALAENIHPGLALCSMFAKMCYASLTLGRNDNITRTRRVHDNILATFDAGHGSVFEHCSVNFVTTNCSRVFTHELVRHRAGTAFSQTSGRYVRTDKLQIVLDPILNPQKDRILSLMTQLQQGYLELVEAFGLNEMNDFGAKKKITSALRRLLPNGQANEIGWSVNLRQLRHMIMVRSSRHAEWEIRKVTHDVYFQMKSLFPLMFSEAREEMVDGLVEVTGLKLQPYEDGALATDLEEAKRLLTLLYSGDTLAAPEVASLRRLCQIP